MQEDEQILYKLELKEKCLSVISERIAVLKKAMENAQVAANSESKSSAGDKYETARSMGQLEKDMYAGQLKQTMLELSAATSVDCSQVYNEIKPGSIVDCGDKQYFFIAGMSKFLHRGQLVVPVSPNAPLAKSLMLKKAGDKIYHNQLTITIVNVY